MELKQIKSMSKINIKKHIPNTLTCLNLVCGCFSILSALNGNLTLAAVWIVAAAIFDFCDGLSARLLKVTSDIGKELDSLSDVVSFGVAPTMIVYKWMRICFLQLTPASQTAFSSFLIYTVFLVPALSAVRLPYGLGQPLAGPRPGRVGSVKAAGCEGRGHP